MNRWGWWGHLNPAIIEFIWTYCTHMWWWTLKHCSTNSHLVKLLLLNIEIIYFCGIPKNWCLRVSYYSFLHAAERESEASSVQLAAIKEIHPFQNAEILLNPRFWNKRCTANLHIVVHQIWWITVLCKILFCSITIWNYYCYHKNLVNVAHFAGSKHFCTKSLHTDFIFYFQSENKEITTEYILKSKR